MDLKSRVDVATGRVPADLVLRGGRIVNVLSNEIHEGDVAISGDRIVGIGEYDGREIVKLDGQFVCPGFIDGHVHIESSMLAVPEFAKVVSAHGTVAVVTDPHEIANVMGTEGIRYMLSSSKHCPIFIYVMLSSCVPASCYESAGAELSAADLEPLLANPWVLGLAEMMNYPGVVGGDPVCLDKIAMMKDRPVDGHAPGLSGRDLCAYVSCGIGSDHECTTADEAREKLRMGLHIMIREGSQARNLEALLPVVTPETLDRFMFVTDDKDVDDLLEQGQIDHMIRKAIGMGMDPIHAIKLATHNTARYFGLNDLGAVAPGRLASIAILEDLKECKVSRVYHAGELIALDGKSMGKSVEKQPSQTLRSSINLHWVEPEHLKIKSPSDGPCDVHVIEVIEDRIDTERSIESMAPIDGCLHADPTRDLAKIAVFERHQASGKVGLSFVRGFGFSGGAIASSVGHDSHNIVVTGTNDADMLAAVIHLVRIRGGFCVVKDEKVLADVALPVGGLMSDVDAQTLSEQLRKLHEAAEQLDGKLRRPFMALSFLTLSVIGQLKLTDQGLIDVDRFELIEPIAT
ncbi:MAG: adenine deaminase [Phycisphaerae bacterium]|nr:MAG: adenine deaminase [Phycisphaerae bacterium]